MRRGKWLAVALVASGTVAGVAVAGLLSVSTPRYSGSPLAASPAEVRFDGVVAGTTTQANVTIINSSSVPVTAIKVETSCGCTAAIDVPESIDANSEAQVSISYLAPHDNELFHHMISVSGVLAGSEDEVGLSIPLTGTIRDNGNIRYFPNPVVVHAEEGRLGGVIFVTGPSSMLDLLPSEVDYVRSLEPIRIKALAALDASEGVRGTKKIHLTTLAENVDKPHLIQIAHEDGAVFASLNFSLTEDTP